MFHLSFARIYPIIILYSSIYYNFCWFIVIQKHSQQAFIPYSSFRSSHSTAIAATATSHAQRIAISHDTSVTSQRSTTHATAWTKSFRQAFPTGSTEWTATVGSGFAQHSSSQSSYISAIVTHTPDERQNPTEHQRTDFHAASQTDRSRFGQFFNGQQWRFGHLFAALGKGERSEEADENRQGSKMETWLCFFGWIVRFIILLTVLMFWWKGVIFHLTDTFNLIFTDLWKLTCFLKLNFDLLFTTIVSVKHDGRVMNCCHIVELSIFWIFICEFL